MVWFYYVAAAGFGLILGSFFNVCIYRLPRKEGLGKRSHCPSCGATIRWYDDVPLVSFIALKGKCRRCGERISWQYPLVEASTALLFVLVLWWSRSVVPMELHLPVGQSTIPELIMGLLLVSVLIIAVGSDLVAGVVPNKVTYPGLVSMLVLVVVASLIRGQPGRIGIAAASGAIGGGFLLAAGLIYGALFLRRGGSGGESDSGPQGENETVATGDPDDFDKEEVKTGIGMGDVKLLALAGLTLGYFHWYLIIVALFLGFLIGALVSILMMIFAGKTRKDKLPFAPALAAGIVIALVWGQDLVNLYTRLLR